MLDTGLVQIYTTDSEWFNFAPFGLALRAAGRKLKSMITSLQAYPLMAGASLVSETLDPYIVFRHAAIPSGAHSSATPEHAFRRAFEGAAHAARAAQFDLVIITGLFEMVRIGIVSPADLDRLVDEKAPRVELVLSGRGAPQALFERADLVTDMRVSGPFDPAAQGPTSDPPRPVEVVTGDGKGKTTYCLGKSMLASCLGGSALVLQFMKTPQQYGEAAAIERFPSLEIRSMGAGFFHPHDTDSLKRHVKAARDAWEHCLREIFSLRYGMVVLDEINTATHFGLVNPRRVREMVFLKPRDLHLLLSGRNADAEVRDAASVVLEMREIKHPFRRGIQARRGIEL